MKKQGTVCFITDKDKVLLLLFEYPNGDKRWSGIGGMVDENESLEDSAIREINEETFINVKKNDLKKVGKIDYTSLILYVFLIEKWNGDLKAKEDSIKDIRWFSKDKLPFAEMHVGNDMWLPKVLSGQFVEMYISSPV